MGKIINFVFGKKKEQQAYPKEFGLITINGVAKSKGIIDDHNKTIIHYRDGREYKRYPYSLEMKKSLEKTYQMPVMEEDYDDEQWEFDTVAEWGVTRLVRKK